MTDFADRRKEQNLKARAVIAALEQLAKEYADKGMAHSASQVEKARQHIPIGGLARLHDLISEK